VEPWEKYLFSVYHYSLEEILMMSDQKGQLQTQDRKVSKLDRLTELLRAAAPALMGLAAVITALAALIHG
jgi:hypothetical protein